MREHSEGIHRKDAFDLIDSATAPAASYITIVGPDGVCLIASPFRRSAFSRSDLMVAERSRDVTTQGLPNAGRRAAVGINRVATFSRAMNLPPLGGSRSSLRARFNPTGFQRSTQSGRVEGARNVGCDTTNVTISSRPAAGGAGCDFQSRAESTGFQPVVLFNGGPNSPSSRFCAVAGQAVDVVDRLALHGLG